jgi:homoserine O-acetyltransferase
MLLLLASALLTFSLGDFQLQSGEVIPDCKVTYRTYGELNWARSNVVVVPTWYSGRTEDFERFVGRGKMADDTKYFVVSIDALANGNSTSPSNHPTLKNEKFPEITIEDMVESQRRLLEEHLEIHRVYAVMGVSMGGMQAFQWMVSYPEFMRKAVPIVATPHMSERDIQLWASAVKLGQNPDEDMPDEVGQPAEEEESLLDKIVSVIGAAAPMYPKYKDPFNPLRQFGAMTRHDVSRSIEGDLRDAAQLVQAEFLTVVATQDTAVSPQTPIEFAGYRGMPVVRLEGECGHKAYDCELDKLSDAIERFLNDPVEAGGWKSGN